jgi:hypothetical protein
MSNHIVKRGVVVVVLTIFISLILIMTMPTVHAFGVSAPYLENDTLIVSPENNYTYSVTLQNGDDKEYDVTVKYHSTKDIAHMTSENIFVPAKNFDTKATFDIIVPKDATIGDVYLLEFNITPRDHNNRTENKTITIPRGLNILVVKNPYVKNTGNPYFSSERFKEDMKQTGRYVLIVVLILVGLAVIFGIWKVSKSISSRIAKKEHEETAEKEEKTTISDAKNIGQIITILKDISDKEFELAEIKKIFHKKITELTSDHTVIDDKTTRRQLIKKLKGHQKK